MTGRRFVSGATRLAIAAFVLSVARSAAAQDRFEIQVYDSEIAAPGSFGVEVHLNTVASGTQQVAGPERPTDHLSHFTLEPHLGATSWLEVGAYVQSAGTAEGQLEYGGANCVSKPVGQNDFGALASV